MARGPRDSPWLVLRRCLAIIRRVQRGPARWQDLVEAVQRKEPDAYGDATGKALRKRLENDLRRIREILGVDLYYSRREGGYIIRDVWLPLLDLPDEDLATLAWLAETFGPDSPQYEQVHGMINRLRLFLGMDRQAEILRCRPVLTVDKLCPRDTDSIPPSIQAQLEQAVKERRWVVLDYVSPQHEDQSPRRHWVAPLQYFYDTTRGHYYLRGWCREITGPEGVNRVDRLLSYRVGRIKGVQILPDVIPSSFPRPRYRVVYELAPEVARLGVSLHREIIGQQVEPRADGSALVRGETEDLFSVVQMLLRYGDRCRVLGGPELLAEMRRTVREMAKIYAESPDHPTLVGDAGQ